MEITARASPKYFFGAFVFEGFCYIASKIGLSDASAGYYFMEGLGDFIGVMFSFLIVTIVFYSPKDYYSQYECGLLSVA